MRYVAVFVLVLAMVIGLVAPYSVVYGEVVEELTVKIYINNETMSNVVVELYFINDTFVARNYTDVNGTAVFYNITTGNYTMYIHYLSNTWVYRVNITNTTSEIVLNLYTPPMPTSNDTEDVEFHSVGGLTMYPGNPIGDTGSSGSGSTSSNSSTSSNTSNDNDWFRGNYTIGNYTVSKYIIYTGVAVGLIILLLLAYAFSGKRIPRRR